MKSVKLVSMLLAVLLLAPFSTLEAKKKKGAEPTDRQYWCNLLYQMSAPVLKNMSEGKLQQEMQVEVSPRWDGRDKKVTYMEAFGRLMMGLAPWLTLPDDDTAEGAQRKQLKEWALKSYAQAVDPNSGDYLLWRKEGQPMVDAAFIASSFLRAFDQLWMPLDDVTKERYINEFKLLRRINPPYNNWLLFSATIETFLFKVGAEPDMYRIASAFRKIEEWYVGDGWYADGVDFSFDYYNSFVIQPMYVECLNVITSKLDRWIFNKKHYERALRRMQRYSVFLERFISPEGTFPVFGRSITYRSAIFQPLSMLAWYNALPKGLTNGQVRAGITASLKRMYANPGNFNEKGFLTIGFSTSQPGVADSYSNNGSMYLASLAFLPLGLPADHPFWTDEPQPWTSKKAWEGMEFPKDGAYHE
ncbi:DUF2264 domain-containing protein [Bacteroides sp. OttesenSCG-928-D19]|nr:DUF2264 domain-containing protein [Bacteroides sp. OttesenSCG-928-D19]